MDGEQRFLDEAGLAVLWEQIGKLFVAQVEGKQLTTEDFTAALKEKLEGLAEDAEKNQDAFSNVKVGEETIAAKLVQDTIEFVNGANVTITPDVEGKTLTISATDTKYENASGTAAGLMSTADYNKLQALPADAQKNQNAFSNLTVGEQTITAASPTDTFTIEGGANVGVTVDVDTKKITIALTSLPLASVSSNGLMSSIDFSKLKGIEEGAQKNTITEIQKNKVKVAPVAGVVNLEIPTDLNQLTNTPGYQNAAQVNAAITSKLAGVYSYKGSVEDASGLPETAQNKGDVYNIEAESDYGPAGTNVAWDGEAWDALGGKLVVEAIPDSSITTICSQVGIK